MLGAVEVVRPGGNAVSIARHAAIAAVTGTVVVAVAVVLLSNGVPGAGRTSSAAGRPADSPPAAASPRRPAPTSAPSTAPTSSPALPGTSPTGAAPKIRAGDPRLGPFDAMATCLHAGNVGMGDGSWGDYECVGGSGNWRIEPR